MIKRPGMKKPSTTTVRRIGKLQDRQLTIGLDLGDRSSIYCVLNGSGEVNLEERVTTSSEAIHHQPGSNEEDLREDAGEPYCAGNWYAFNMGKPPSVRAWA
jgi:hypothetical protein